MAQDIISNMNNFLSQSQMKPENQNLTKPVMSLEYKLMRMCHRQKGKGNSTKTTRDIFWFWLFFQSIFRKVPCLTQQGLKMTQVFNCPTDLSRP